MSDESRWLAAATAGDPSAFERLVRLHYPRIYGTAFHLVGSHEDAEDLAQECFLKAHAGLRWYRGRGALASWLRSILVHLVRDRFRRAARRPQDSPLAMNEGEEADPVVAGSGPVAPANAWEPVHELRRHELARLVDEALRRLPDGPRIALVLRTREGLEYDEIAGATGVTPATARTQVMRARKLLMQRLAPYLGGHES